MKAWKHIDAVAAAQNHLFVHCGKPASTEGHAELVAHREIRPQCGNQGISEIAECVQGEKAREIFLQDWQVSEEVGELPEDQVEKIEHVAKTEEVREGRMYPWLHADAQIGAYQRPVDGLQRRVFPPGMDGGDGGPQDEIEQIHRDRIEQETQSPAQVAVAAE